jgi:hypothetical protein
MQTDEWNQTQSALELPQTEPRSFGVPEPTRRDRSSLPDGLSFSKAIEDDSKSSMQAVGQVCRVAVMGVLVCGVGGAAALLGLLLF